MITKISHMTLFVHDQEEALKFYTEKLGFVCTADFPMGSDYRWLTIAPTMESETVIVLHKATEETQKALIGKQVGQGILFIVQSDDCHADCETLKSRGVHFRSEPEAQFYGIEAILEDLYGNRIDMVQPTEQS